MPSAKTKTAPENPLKVLRSRLSNAGVKRAFLDRVVLPEWWDDSMALSPGGFREVAGYISSHLGLSLKSLLNVGTPLAFYPQTGVKYKKSKTATDDEVALATQLALGVARTVAAAFAEDPPFCPVPEPSQLRRTVLKVSGAPWVTLRDIVRASWNHGIPVLHLRNVPSGAKKPDALTTMIGGRPVIVILSGRKSPSWIAFILAHELGHIHRGHLKPGETLVDQSIDSDSTEREEVEANDFAVALLTGQNDFAMRCPPKVGIPQLASRCREFGQKYRVAPGVAALNYGFATKSWSVANGAVSILEKDDDAATDLSAAMNAHLRRDSMSEEAWEWIGRATGAEA